MNKNLIALASSLLLLGATAAPAFAQDSPPYPDPIYANGDADHDSIPNADDPVDNRYDEAGNPVMFEVGDQLPAGAIGNNTVAAWKGRVHAPGTGQTWHRLGDNYYLVDGAGVVIDAVYNLHD